jgi:hypothetical protein
MKTERELNEADYKVLDIISQVKNNRRNSITIGQLERLIDDDSILKERTRYLRDNKYLSELGGHGSGIFRLDSRGVLALDDLRRKYKYMVENANKSQNPIGFASSATSEDTKATSPIE